MTHHHWIYPYCRWEKSLSNTPLLKITSSLGYVNLFIFGITWVYLVVGVYLFSLFLTASVAENHFSNIFLHELSLWDFNFKVAATHVQGPWIYFNCKIWIHFHTDMKIGIFSFSLHCVYSGACFQIIWGSWKVTVYFFNSALLICVK